MPMDIHNAGLLTPSHTTVSRPAQFFALNQEYENVSVDLGSITKKLLLEASNQVETAKRIDSIEENLMYQKYVAAELIAKKIIRPEDHPAALEVIESSAKNLCAIRELRVQLGIGSKFDVYETIPPLPDNRVLEAQNLLQILEPEREVIIQPEREVPIQSEKVVTTQCERNVTIQSGWGVTTETPSIDAHPTIDSENWYSSNREEIEEDVLQAAFRQDIHSAPPKPKYQEPVEVVNQDLYTEPHLTDDEEIKIDAHQEDLDEGFAGDLESETGSQHKQAEKIKQEELALVEEELKQSGIIHLESPQHDNQSELDSAAVSLAPSLMSLRIAEDEHDFKFFFGIKDFSKQIKKKKENLLSEIVHMPGRRPHLQAGVGFYPGKTMMVVLRHSRCECPGTLGSIEDTRKVRVTAFVVDQKKGENDYSIGSEVMQLRGGGFGWNTGLVAMTQCTELEKRKLITKNKVLLRYEILELS